MCPAHVFTGTHTSWLLCRQSDDACELIKEVLSHCQDGVEEEVVFQGGMREASKAGGMKGVDTWLRGTREKLGLADASSSFSAF